MQDRKRRVKDSWIEYVSSKACDCVALLGSALLFFYLLLPLLTLTLGLCLRLYGIVTGSVDQVSEVK